MSIGDEQRGLYGKYRVERIHDPDGKHRECPLFVLDLQHDRYAGSALQAYIAACRDEYPQLAADLEQLVRRAPQQWGWWTDEEVSGSGPFDSRDQAVADALLSLDYDPGEQFYVAPITLKATFAEWEFCFSQKETVVVPETVQA